MPLKTIAGTDNLALKSRQDLDDNFNYLLGLIGSGGGLPVNDPAFTGTISGPTAEIDSAALGDTTITGTAAIIGASTVTGTSAVTGSSSLTAASGNASHLIAGDSTGWTQSLVEPKSTLPHAGNMQAGVATAAHLSGLFNPVSYANLTGRLDQFYFYNGQNTFADKKTGNGYLLNSKFMAAGQRYGLHGFVDFQGMGDGFGSFFEVQYGGYASAPGDEGASGSSVLLSQPSSLWIVTTTGVVLASSGVTALAEDITPSTGPTDIKTYNVTGSTASINVGDWLTLDNSPLEAGADTDVETIRVTGKTSGTLSSLIQRSHSSGAPIVPAPVLQSPDFAAGFTFGQGRWIINRTATPYTTGTISSISGRTITGSGTSWNPGGTGVGPLTGGTVNMPGAIAFVDDDVTSVPFSGGEGPLISWYPILSIDSDTQITLDHSHTGPATGGNYIIRPCARVGALQVDYAASEETISGVVLESNAIAGGSSGFSWASPIDVEQSISPYGGGDHVIYGAVSWYTGMTPTMALFKGANNGITQVNSGLLLTGFGKVPGDGNNSGYNFPIHIESNYGNSGIFIEGRAVGGGSGLNLHTYNDVEPDAKSVTWGGAVSADIYPDISTGNLIIDAKNAGKLGLKGRSVISGNSTWTLDYHNITDNRTVTAPDASGTAAVISGSPSNNDPVKFSVSGGVVTLAVGTGGGGATIDSTTNLIKGDGSGNGVDSGITIGTSTDLMGLVGNDNLSTSYILKALANNGTQGFGISYDGLHSIGSDADITMRLMPKGVGSLIVIPPSTGNVEFKFANDSANGIVFSNDGSGHVIYTSGSSTFGQTFNGAYTSGGAKHRFQFGGTDAATIEPTLGTFAGGVKVSAAAVIRAGTGSPESAVTGNVGDLWLRTDGGAATSIYVKESGSGNTGWVGK